MHFIEWKSLCDDLYFIEICSSGLNSQYNNINWGYGVSPIWKIIIKLPSSLQYKTHFSMQLNCWSLRPSWSIACQRCSNYIFILDLTPGFNGLGEAFKFWDSVRLILETLWYVMLSPIQCSFTVLSASMTVNIDTWFNASSPGQNGWHISDNISNLFFLKISFVFWFKFPGSLCLRVLQLTMVT